MDMYTKIFTLVTVFSVAAGSAALYNYRQSAQVAHPPGTFLVTESHAIQNAPKVNYTPDVLYIFDGANLQGPKKIIKPQIRKDKRATPYQMVGDRFYFFNSETLQVEWLDGEGKTHPLSFTKLHTGDCFYCHFLVSPDGKWITWSDLDYGGKPPIRELWISDIEGKSPKILYDDPGPYSGYYEMPVPLKWSTRGNSILFAEQTSEEKPFKFFEGYKTLRRVNIATQKVTKVFPAANVPENFMYFTDISPDENSIVYVAKTAPDEEASSIRMGIKNLKSDSDTAIPFPNEESYLCGGEARFSYDGKSVAFAVGQCDFANAHKSYLMSFDLASKTTRQISEQQYNIHVMQWITNATILFNANDKFPPFLINKDGVNLRTVPLELVKNSDVSFTLSMNNEEHSQDSNDQYMLITFHNDGTVDYSWSYSGYYPGEEPKPIQKTFQLTSDQRAYVINLITKYHLDSNVEEIKDSSALGNATETQFNLTLDGKKYVIHLKGMTGIINSTKNSPVLSHKNVYDSLSELAGYIGIQANAH